MPNQTLTPALLDAALTYPQYRALVSTLAQEHRTSGPEQKPLLIRLTHLNQELLDQAYEHPLLPELIAALRALPQPWRWVVLAEAWCGDTSQHLPVLAHLAAESAGRVELRVLLRSEHPAVMEAHLTDGKASIPKLVCLDAATLTERGTWGPRPAAAQTLAAQLHADKDLHVMELIKRMNAWAAADQGQSVQRELLALMPAWQQVAKVA